MGKLITVVTPLVRIKHEVLRKVYYPYMFYHVEVLLKGLMGRSRKVKGYVAVDMVRGLTFLADSMPKTYKEEVSVDDIIPPRISFKDAERLAKKKMVWVAMRKIKTIFPVTVSILDELYAYKLFLLIVEEGKKYIVDTVTGEREEYLG